MSECTVGDDEWRITVRSDETLCIVTLQQNGQEIEIPLENIDAIIEAIRTQEEVVRKLIAEGN